jgi:hypothetical protein
MLASLLLGVALAPFLMPDRAAEVAMARSAAPTAISHDATVMVLTRRGYEVAASGTNGFTCLVERSWDAPFDATGFWDPGNLGPDCYNPAASRTVLRAILFRAQLAAAGLSKDSMLSRTQAAVASKKIPAAEPGSMSYMLSQQQRLGAHNVAWKPHFMIYVPSSNAVDGGASWGANARYSPILFDTSGKVVPEPWTIMMIPVATWSDGTPSK